MQTEGNLGTIRLTGEDLTALRVACFRRDRYRCVECGQGVTDSPHAWYKIQAQMAHLIGRGAGGPDTLDNVRCLCGECHVDGEHNPKSVRAK